MSRLNSGRAAHALFAVLAVALVALAVPSHAQTLYGSIVGNVEDTTGAAVPGATVTIVQKGTNLARDTVTTADGSYRFSNVEPGDYAVKVSLTGFKERVQEGVPVSANTVSRVNVALEVGALTETVTVTSERALLQTDSGDLHTELQSKEVTQMPLGAYRNYQALINLVPGATPARFQNAVADTPARSLSTNVNGAARNNNNTKVDGTSAVFVWLPHHAVYVEPAVNIEWVNITTNAFDAEQGMSGGAAISVRTKSGTNEFHGSGFAFHENEGLRAKNWAQPGEKQDSSRNIDGATLGGPIIKEKLFFFAGYEGTFEKTPFTAISVVPTADMRAGDFSSFGTVIYDPATGDPATGVGRTPFPGNVIPPDRMSSIALAIQDLIPDPTSGSDHVVSDTQDLTRHNLDVKLNYHFNPSAQIWAKYSMMDAAVETPPRFAELNGGGIDGAAGTCDTKVQLGTFGLTWTLSPNIVVDGTFGLADFDQICASSFQGTNFGSDVLGIPGTNGEGGTNGDIRASGWPRFSISGFRTLGNPSGWTPIFRNDRTYTGSANLTWVSDKHEIRFGFGVERLELNHWQPELGSGPRGRFDFNGGATALAGGAAPNSTNAYAQFLLGLTDRAGKSIQHETFTGREWQLAFYVRDRWQVTPNVTLNLGLRFERYPLMRRADRGIEKYDIATNQVLLGGIGGNPDNLGIDVSTPAILPRFGLSWRINDENVFRAGFGVTVSGTPFARPLRGFFPQVIASDFVGDNSFSPFGSLESGIPLFFGPEPGQGAIDLPPSAAMGFAADTVHRSNIRSWNLTYERKLPGDISVATSYVGTQTKDGMGFLNINASDAGQGTAGQPLFAAFGRTNSMLLFDGYLDTSYHALQVAVNKPFSGGLFIKGAYTWSKALNRVDDDGWATPDWNSDSQFSRNYAQAGFHRPHMFQLGFVADLPLGDSVILDDWQLSGTLSALAGTPFRLSASGASVDARGNRQTPDQVGEITNLGGIGAGDPFYDPNAFAAVTDVRFGNVGRNIIRGPAWYNMDLALTRSFRLGERVQLQARVEAYNITNTPHFNNPNGSFTSSRFLQITSTSGNALSRQIRLGARLSF